MSMAYEEYMKQIIKPMRTELTRAGFQEFTSEDQVEEFFENETDYSFVVVNSVCGCAAGLARPAATQAVLQTEESPKHLITVFAGQDKEATAKFREYLSDFEPSSPSMAILKGKEVVHFIPREQIEDHTIEEIIQNIQTGFEKM
ncbi:hypothetical protein Q73_07715 [Bacillus coahuilensis m2-6]|uniref:BrxA/BrxB family bacilliredoxin n=1 Tax=Bacillus coahuilensis p1.1.43 TaxID=1150625 RepID=A0A147K8L9_9BACI|nr:BrxA/BrxB family bacilliredoxin [Bacillus coahuilensis]KUP06498.1 hypothetical protein Q75_08195 [Bacillus coahuilensis p1.1.43]KUP07985.1 hypothetical protein Q73_07715 [Bacillus coahuilensis m2-6]